MISCKTAQVHLVYIDCNHSNHTTESCSREDAPAKDQDDVITVRERIPFSLYCSVIGGNPTPGVAVYVGSDDVTKIFRVSSRDQVVEGVRGLRKMIRETQMTSSKPLTLSDEHDYSVIRCAANIPGMAPSYADVRLRVLCKINVSVTLKIRCLSHVLRTKWK